MHRKRVARKRVTLGRSFQLVKETGMDYGGNSGWQATVIGAVFLGFWWWIVGAPDDEPPAHEAA